MSAELNDDSYRFSSGGPFNQVLSRIGLGASGLEGIKKRMGVIVLLTYFPLLVLSTIQGFAYNPNIKLPFLFDVTEAVRFIFVGPLLIFSEAFIEQWLDLGVKYMRKRLVDDIEREKFESFVASARRWRDSYLIEIIFLFCLVPLQLMDMQNNMPVQSSSWRFLSADAHASYAWFWFAFFARPLIRFLVLRLLWRYVIWSLFLCRISGLDLKVIPTHPDRHGGLTFIASCHEKFSLIAFIFGLQVASTIAEKIIFEGRSLLSFQFEVLGVIMVVYLTFLTPLLAFTGKLLQAKRRGLFEYGILADEYSTAFHNKWVDAKGREESILGTSDIQSLADMSNSYQIVNEMRLCLINKSTLLTFIIASLLPFAPLILSVYPFDVLVHQVLKVVM